MSINLKAQARELKKGNLDKNRAEGKVPAVLYGQGKENKNIWINNLEFEKVFAEAGENTIVSLEIEDGGKENVLIYDYQVTPLRGKFTHVDFLRVNMKEEIQTEVPLVFLGESPAVKEKGGILVKVIDEVEVKCLPGNIPHEFNVDLSNLIEFEDRFTVGDLIVPENVEILESPETVIASIAEPRSEEDLAELNEKVEEDVSKVAGVKESAPEGAEESK